MSDIKSSDCLSSSVSENNQVCISESGNYKKFISTTTFTNNGTERYVDIRTKYYADSGDVFFTKIGVTIPLKEFEEVFDRIKKKENFVFENNRRTIAFIKREDQPYIFDLKTRNKNNSKEGEISLTLKELDVINIVFIPNP